MIRRFLRGLFRLGLLALLGYVVYRLIAEREPAAPSPGAPLDRRGLGETSGPPETTRRPGAGTKPGGSSRPPAAKPEQPEPTSVRSIGVGEVPAHVQKWVEPADDGSCPVSHPVKAKTTSGIFHVPGGRHYERTHADRCYRDADAAEADGLRQSKQ